MAEDNEPFSSTSQRVMVEMIHYSTKVQCRMERMRNTSE